VQAIRVVTRLENRYATHDGLNLTWETLEGILKHNGPLIDAEGRPAGRYSGEGLPAGLDDIPASADLQLSTYASLEAQCAAIADDIAYNAHDIDDALRAGLISLDDLAEVPLVGAIVRHVHDIFAQIEAPRQAHEIQRRLITQSIEDVIAASTSAIALCSPQSPGDVRHAGQTLIRFSSEIAQAEQGLKRFLFDSVYRSEPVMGPVRQSQAVVAALFDHYMSSADMPGRWGETARAAENDAQRARIVCDFIAGMTDPYALDDYARLFDARIEFR
jgi:dGTPase